jgi:hypothetical protein
MPVRTPFEKSFATGVRLDHVGISRYKAEKSISEGSVMKAAGAVVSGTDSAGLIGVVTGPVTLTDLYWNEGTSGQTKAIAATSGTVTQTNVTGIGGTTGRSPTAQATYVGFDFTHIWTINPGVSPPTLRP